MPAGAELHQLVAVLVGPPGKAVVVIVRRDPARARADAERPVLADSDYAIGAIDLLGDDDFAIERAILANGLNSLISVMVIFSLRFRRECRQHGLGLREMLDRQGGDAFDLEVVAEFMMSAPAVSAISSSPLRCSSVISSGPSASGAVIVLDAARPSASLSV